MGETGRADAPGLMHGFIVLHCVVVFKTQSIPVSCFYKVPCDWWNDISGFDHVIACRNPSKRGESFGISRIGSKIKGVFKSSTMEGALLPQYAMIEGEDDMVTPFTFTP